MKRLMLLLMLSVPIMASEQDKEKQKVPSPELQKAIDKSTGVLSDSGSKAGLLAVWTACEFITSWGGSIKVAAASTKAYIASAGASAAATVTSPAVVVPAGVVGAGYAGYKTYRYFYPPKKVQAEESEAIEKLELSQCRRDKLKSEKDFKDCLSRNHPACRVTVHGYPEECQKEAYKLAMHKGGDSEVLELTRKHVMFAPIPPHDKE